MIRVEAGLSVARFVTLLGMPWATWYRWRAAVGADRPAKGPWPAPVVDALEPLAAKHAEAFDAWGYRMIWGCCGPTASSPASPRCGGRWAAVGCCSRSATRPNGASWRPPGEQRSCIRPPAATGSDRPTSASLRAWLVGSGA